MSKRFWGIGLAHCSQASSYSFAHSLPTNAGKRGRHIAMSALGATIPRPMSRNRRRRPFESSRLGGPPAAVFASYIRRASSAGDASMTPQEAQLVNDLFDRLAKLESAPRDAAA